MNRKKNKKKAKQNKQKQQQHIITPALQFRWRCYQAIVLNDQQV